MILIPRGETRSEPFKIDVSKQITLLAVGLLDCEFVSINIVGMTPAGPPRGVCCPGPVALPEIDWCTPLMHDTPNGLVPITLTRKMPWLVMDAPQEVWLQAVVHNHEQSVCDCASSTVEVHKINTDSKLI